MSQTNKVYQGVRAQVPPGQRGACKVFVNGEELEPYLHIRNHSPDGFEWGYGGSGPAQLALAIMCDFWQSTEAACFWYQKFKSLIARLPHDEWIITGADIMDWTAAYSHC
jgi:hypothetical protein